MDRASGERGFCGAGAEMEVASVVVHQGEEPFFTGDAGTGNVFFNHCSMACVYCQNHQISRRGSGKVHSSRDLAEALLGLQERGCPTVGFVSPGHYLPLVAQTISLAREMGLAVPVIWNSNGYEVPELLELLHDLVDIWLPDLKYMDDDSALEYSSTPGYAEAARSSIMEMFRLAGPLRVENGIATGGLCVRHLVLPNDLSGTTAALEFIAGISTDIPVSLMSQYNPVYRADEYPLLSRRVSPGEYWKAVETAEKLGLHRTLIQELESSPDHYLPDFTLTEPFRDQGPGGTS